MTGALSDIRVIEVGDHVSGPYAARLLADAGADVIKVEPPSGDSARRLGPFPGKDPDPDWSGLFAYLNWSKRGIALDLDDPTGRATLDELLAVADVLVVNLPLADLERLGLRYDRLRRLNPTLIVTAITPFGLTGPKSGYTGDDLIAVASGGLAYASPGVPDMPADAYAEPPIRADTPMGELLAGIQAATATIVALEMRAFDGAGAEVDVSAQESVAAIMTWEVSHASYHESKTRDPVVAGAQPNTYLPCQDGYVVLAAFLDHHWRGLVKAMGSPDWGDLEVFNTGAERALNWDVLGPLIGEWALQHTGEEIARLCHENHVPSFPAYGIGDMMRHEHVRERGYLRSWPAPGGKDLKLPGFPARLSKTPLREPAPWPAIGQHNAELVHGLLGRPPGGTP